MRHTWTFGLAFCLACGTFACGTDDSSTGTEPDTSADAAADADSGSDAEDDTIEDDVLQRDAATDATPALPEPDRHRASAGPCDPERDDTPFDPDMGPGGDCESHDDCTDGENGRCTNLGRWTTCTYDGCFADSECGDTACICDGGSGGENVCMSGDCQVDADCGEGGWCSPSFGDCGHYSGVVAYYCHTPQDECVNDSECGDTDDSWGGYCAFNPALGYWACSDSECVGK